jgi:protein-disulfide isomerase
MKPSLYKAVFVTILALSASSYAADASSFKPPAGAKVAIVMFEDLECPDCAANYPVVWEQAKLHQIPVMLYDFPLPRHNWSFDAAVWARFFDTKSQKIGNDFRGFIYANQIQITKGNLQQWVQKFGDSNKVPLPFVKDPEGKLAALVRADYSLGQRIGIEHTPTVFVIGRGSVAAPFVEVVDRNQLSQNIEDMLKKAGPATPSKQAATKPRKKKAS